MTTPLSSQTIALSRKKPKKKAKSDATTNREDENEEEEEEEAVKIARREALAMILRDDLRTPYLTCQRCNSVTFINVNRVRTNKKASREINEIRLDTATELVEGETPLSAFEQLPVCSGCGTTKYLRAGVVSFQDKIEEEKQKIKEFEQKRVPATHLLVRIGRGFLGRLAFRRRKREHELYLWRIRVAATRIQSRVRGMQARKRTVYERCLRVIRTMHPSILQFALTARSDHAPVFWYDHPGELQILFWNYREFVRRSGGKPPLFKVESNILEITRRMLLREHELVSRIQSRWRGLTTRLVFFEFKRQRGWLRGLQQSPAIKIQRLVRAHHARHQCRALQAVRSYPARMATYRDERAQQRKVEMAKTFRKKLLTRYRVTYQAAKTCKMLALERPEEEDEEQQTDRTPAVVGAVDVQHSLRQATHSHHRAAPERERSEAARSQQLTPLQPPRQRHPNARKLLEMKRLVDAQKSHARGPRLRLLHAQQFARDELSE